MEKDDRDDVKEYEEGEEDLRNKVKSLAEKVKKSQHFVAFTGAGISTSAKIPDFRGPKGVWTMKQQGKEATMEITCEQAVPTTCHMALVELQNQNVLKYVVSQNVDGLHKRSGIKPEQISELHGNIYLEVCDDCGTEYLRPFSVTEHSGDDVDCSKMSFTEMAHCTGRRCDACKGILRDTIINFGESLPSYILKRAKKNSKQCDLMLILGSSLTVSPANQLPLYATEMVIVNMQKTEYDSKAALRIFAKTDTVMQMLMEELGYKIPSFTLEQMKLTLTYQPTNPEERISRKPAPKPDTHPIVSDTEKEQKGWCLIL